MEATLKKPRTPLRRGKKKAETLEAKILRLYGQGHYDETEVEMFFAIPKEHRIDPFDIIEGGDTYFADQRNVDYVNENIERAHRAKEAGELVSLMPGESFDEFMERIMADESI